MHGGSLLPVDERRSLISTGAAARLAGVHSTTIWRAIREGELPATRLGPHGHYRVARQELEAWLQPTTEEKT
jgi:excisionase family DNA binding protein